MAKGDSPKNGTVGRKMTGFLNGGSSSVSSDYPTVSEEEDYEDDDEDPLKDFRPLDDSLVYAVRYSSAEDVVDKEREVAVVEVMPKKDVPKVRVQLKSSFAGIPLSSETSQNRPTNSFKIDKSHTHYELAVGMMMGIRECVGGMDGLREIEFDEKDFFTQQLLQECRRNRKYSFPPAAVAQQRTRSKKVNGSTPTIKRSNSSSAGGPEEKNAFGYQFKAYAPLVFARIRSHFGIDKQLFLHSICGNFSFLEFMSNAKSGSFFFFSHDGKYLIKTLTVDESRFLQAILPHYYHYLVHNNPHSFLTRFYGLYRLQTATQQIHFSIMGSVFDTSLPMTHTFDLKGSTLGRKAKPSETVRKDLDFKAEGRKLKCGPTHSEIILKQLRRDATFLARLGIMDYSFLLGVHDVHDETSLEEPVSTVPTKQNLQQHQQSVANDEETAKTREGISTNEDNRDDDAKQSGENNLSLLEGQESRSPEQEDEYVDLDTFVEWKPNETDDSSINTSVVSFESCHECFSILMGLEGEVDELFSGRESSRRLTTRQDGGIVSHNRKEIYFCGIIDILQPYNARKWGETVVKKVQGNAAHEISCVDPETYANRFIKFLTQAME